MDKELSDIITRIILDYFVNKDKKRLHEALVMLRDYYATDKQHSAVNKKGVQNEISNFGY